MRKLRVAGAASPSSLPNPLHQGGKQGVLQVCAKVCASVVGDRPKRQLGLGSATRQGKMRMRRQVTQGGQGGPDDVGSLAGVMACNCDSMSRGKANGRRPGASAGPGGTCSSCSLWQSQLVRGLPSHVTLTPAAGQRIGHVLATDGGVAACLALSAPPVSAAGSCTCGPPMHFQRASPSRPLPRPSAALIVSIGTQQAIPLWVSDKSPHARARER